MTTYVCVKNCFWQDKMWKAGETLVWTDEKTNPPKHFKILEGEKETDLAENFKKDQLKSVPK